LRSSAIDILLGRVLRSSAIFIVVRKLVCFQELMLMMIIVRYEGRMYEVEVFDEKRKEEIWTSRG
jgi:hypothetical protein